jgi:hypothetical protein
MQHVHATLCRAGERVLLLAECEVALYGTYMLTARFEVGRAIYRHEVEKLDQCLEMVNDKGLSDVLLRRARTWRDKLMIDMALEEALVSFWWEETKQQPQLQQHHHHQDASVSRPRTSYTFVNGKVVSTLLEALQYQSHLLHAAVERAMNFLHDEDHAADDDKNSIRSTTICPALLHQARELITKLKKDMKEEQKHEEERRRIAEEEALKAAKKGKKKGGKAKK